MSDLDWALALSCYLLMHFFVYVIDLRRRRFFRTEKGIFLLHMVSALAIVAVVAGAFLWSPNIERFALLIAAGAAHGIYSLSFLEIWVLSEGGYSLRILNELVARGGATTEALERQFTDLSARKKMGRIESLMSLGLIEPQDGRIGLTGKGRSIAGLTAAIAALAGFRASS
jgi:hypothetical protein